MKAKSSYKSQINADRKRGHKQKQKLKAAQNGASNWHEISKTDWMAQVGYAVSLDDVEALKILARDSRFSVLDIHVDVTLDAGAVASDQPLMVVASNVGAVKCLEQLCFISASTDNVAVLGEITSSLYARYESEDGHKGDLERMILAALEGAEKGYEGAVPGIYLTLSLNFPSATRFGMASMADRSCGAVEAPAYLRAHNENKRKLFGAMARGDAKAIDFHLRETQSNLQENANLILGLEEVKRLFQVAAACGRPESIIAAFKTMRGLQCNLDQKGAVLGLLMTGVEELGLTVNMVRKPWLDEVMEECVTLDVIEDRKLGDTILAKAGKFFVYALEATNKGAQAGIAELERRELASHIEMNEVIERANSAVRI